MNAAAPVLSPKQLHSALVDIATQLVPRPQVTAPDPHQLHAALLKLAAGVQRSPWYQWERIQQCDEARRIDLEEARGIISAAEACRRRIALLIVSDAYP